MGMNEAFWDALDALVKGSRIVIDRPKGSVHLRYPELEYPLDYGYLEETRSTDGYGIDVWIGTDPSRIMDALICTVDRLKKDSEIKVLIGCTTEEKALIQEIYDRSESMKGLLILRNKKVRDLGFWRRAPIVNPIRSSLLLAIKPYRAC